MRGDGLLSRAQHRATRAITIDAAPDEVRPWLVQVGYRRAGWYAGDLDDFPRPNVRRIVPELQDLRVGQWPSTVPRPTEPTPFRGDGLAEPSWLLWRMPNRTWARCLTPLPGGSTRLVTRMKARNEWPRPSALMTVVPMEFAEPGSPPYPYRRPLLTSP
ncbi:hypothetical protein [Actinomadura sp. GTD37]|uniref:hypothetical protein n=1 Tax=Actinomadura sp. GTD37 TaxID=1778030 RepID=UPI0035C25EBD